MECNIPFCFEVALTLKETIILFVLNLTTLNKPNNGRTQNIYGRLTKTIACYKAKLLEQCENGWKVRWLCDGSTNQRFFPEIDPWILQN